MVAGGTASGAAPMKTMELTIRGMSCSHCVARVTKALASLPGVSVGQVEVGRATIQLDPATTSLAQIGAALDAAGFALQSSGETA
jgi:copper chaperone CopZ